MRDITNRNRAHAQALQAKGIDVVDIDVTDDESVERGVESVIAQAGRLDVLINNAGIGSQGVSESFTTDQLRALFEVNVFGVQRTLRAVLPTLRRQEDGLVINIGSILGRVTLPFFGLYGASKFAVEAITDSYRYELSQLGIDVVLVQHRDPHVEPQYQDDAVVTGNRGWPGVRAGRATSEWRSRTGGRYRWGGYLRILRLMIWKNLPASVQWG